MLTEEKKTRINSLTKAEMEYEINLGRRSRFQREAFAYLQCCYQAHMAEDAHKQILEIAKIEASKTPTPNLPTNPSHSIPKNTQETNKWYQKPIGQIGLIIIGGILLALAIYLIGQFTGLPLH